MPSGDNFRKLSYEIAEEIRFEYVNKYITHKELAEKYGVSVNAITLILNNKNYRKRGEDMPSGDNFRKLNMDIARKIRHLYSTTNIKQKELAKMFNVCNKSIWQIVHNVSYKEDEWTNHHK